MFLQHSLDSHTGKTDVTADTVFNPERLFFKPPQAEALFSAYDSRDYRERSMAADQYNKLI